MKKKCTCGGLQAYAEGGRTRVPTRSTRFIDPEAERIRGRSALEALRGYAGAPSQSSAMYPGSQEAYESGELAGMAEMLIPGAAMAKGALGAALAGVIKPRGGNWLTGGVESSIENLFRREYSPEAMDLQKKTLEFARQRGYPDAMIVELTEGLQRQESPAALNRWIGGPLTKYIKRDMATPDDPVRRLADEGILHIGIPQTRGTTPSWLGNRRRVEGFPEGGMSTTPGGSLWEQLSDQVIDPMRADVARAYANDTPQGRASKEWLEKLPPGDTVYDTTTSTIDRSLGFDHLVDELSNAMDPASGLPRNLQLRPEQMQQMGMEKAVRHVDAINKWREAQRAAANQELANKALAIREYPDTPELPNPKGLRWVELGKDSPDLEKQLKYEGETMGHCVGGYCPDVLEGKSRIFSLRDAKGEPHVTVEVNPMSKDDFIDRNYAVYVDMLSEGREFADRWADKSARSKFSIAQIKGKANKRPKDEYLPFVQDFVRNSPLGGTWGDVGDLGNARLHRVQDGSGIKYLTPEEYNLPRRKEGGLVTQPDYFDDLDAFLRR